jgi:alpha-beta hydrolase superfamily lysophospholipase
MTGTPIWFGPPERPLFGMVHVPEGNIARAAVVLCSPLGREDLHAHGTYRELAQRLEDQGIAVLRFDYDGTGDSAGAEHDPARVAAWSSSIQVAVDLMRSIGPSVVAVVGMRMGATLGAIEASRRPVDALVLWDPCRSGRAYLREQRALYVLSGSGSGPDDGSVQTPGFRYNAATVAELGALDIVATDGPMADRILVLSRPEQQLDQKLNVRLTNAGKVDHDAALGQYELLNVDGQAVAIPEQTVDRVVTWLSSVAGEPVPLLLEHLELSARAAVVGHDSRSRPIVERPVRIGEADLFGIVTEVEGATSPTTVLCLNVAKERAGDGLRTLRVDLSGLGDSATHPGQIRGRIYPADAMADVEEVARAMEPDDPSRVVLVGLCSGAFHALQGGLLLRAQGVCTINPVFSSGPPPIVMTDGTNRQRRPISSAIRRWGYRTAGRRLPKAVLDGMPESAWKLIHRFGVRHSPADALVSLVGAGTDVLVVAGADESLRIRRGAVHVLRELVRSGGLRFDVIDDLEHSMHGAEDRPRIAEIVSRHVREHFDPCRQRAE